jgi:hypothetical protein
MHEDGSEFIEETHLRHVFESLGRAGMIGRSPAEQADCGFLSYQLQLMLLPFKNAYPRVGI